MTEREFKEGDVVRIFKQPEGHHVHLQGKVGVIGELGSNRILFEELKLDGGYGGSGGVSKSCIELVTDPKWINARDERERKMSERIAAMDEENRKRKLAVAEAKRRVGEEFGIDDALVESIISSHRKTLSEELDKAGLHEHC